MPSLLSLLISLALSNVNACSIKTGEYKSLVISCRELFWSIKIYSSYAALFAYPWLLEHPTNNKLAAENPTLHARVWKLIDNQAKRAVVEPTIGNKNIRASSNSFFKILFQFKNFAFYATNSQAFRKLSNREREDFLSTAYETAFAAGITYLGILGAAYSKHWNNEADRQSYIDKRTDDFLWGVATRSGTIGSPIAFAVDFADTMGWKQSFRTTSGSSRYANNGDLITTAARGVAQSPALETLSLMLQNTYGYYDTGLTQENIKDTAKIYIPANNNYFMAGVLNNMIESFDIPEK